MKICPLVFVGLALLFCLSCTGQKANQKVPDITPLLKTESSPEFPEPPSDEEMDKWVTDSYKPVIEKWLRGDKIPRDVELPRTDIYAANSERNGTTTLLDVNRDGVKELALQTGCATVGNCTLLVFQKTKESYRVILVANLVQQLKTTSSTSKGYLNIETRSHGSAISGGLEIYKFDGAVYKIADCFNYEYKMIGIDKKGQGIVNAVPTLTPTACKDY